MNQQFCERLIKRTFKKIEQQIKNHPDLTLFRALSIDEMQAIQGMIWDAFNDLLENKELFDAFIQYGYVLQVIANDEIEYLFMKSDIPVINLFNLTELLLASPQFDQLKEEQKIHFLYENELLSVHGSQCSGSTRKRFEQVLDSIPSRVNLNYVKNYRCITPDHYPLIEKLTFRDYIQLLISYEQPHNFKPRRDLEAYEYQLAFMTYAIDETTNPDHIFDTFDFKPIVTDQGIDQWLSNLKTANQQSPVTHYLKAICYNLLAEDQSVRLSKDIICDRLDAMKATLEIYENDIVSGIFIHEVNSMIDNSGAISDEFDQLKENIIALGLSLNETREKHSKFNEGLSL